MADQGFLSRLSTLVKRVIRISMVVRQVAGVLKIRILDKNNEYRFAYHLKVGNELCKGRMIPMSPQLITKVEFIYRKSQLDFPKSKSTPVMTAAFEGYADMVWGFIQCSKQTRKNLHTQTAGKPEDFLWLRRHDGQTALDIAITGNHLEVAKLLLSHATGEELASVWDSYGKNLFPLIHDHRKHDGFIFNKLEEEKTRAQQGLPPITIKESKLYYLKAWNTVNMLNGRDYIEKLNIDLLQLINPNTNTILHIASKIGDVGYVNFVLEKEPSLISCLNSDGETPVYVAAREGHVDILLIMVDYLKGNNKNIEWHATRAKDNDNALHIAIQNHHAPVVFWLLNEIPKLANHENVFKESPLYLAAGRGYFEIVKQIWNKCSHKSFRGPKGKTALHAAAISNSAECVEYLLQERPDLVNVKDENDWSPWRYAVHYNSSLAMKELLKVDHSIGFQLVTEDDTVTSALHIAASRGHCETMKVLMKICLGSRECDSKGRNILHVAIESKQTEVIEFIFQDESLTSLINQKDNNGNTPAHLLAHLFAESNFEMIQKIIDSRVNIYSINNEGRTPLDMIESDEKRERLIKAIAMGTNLSDNKSSSSPNIHKNDLYEKELEGKQKKAEAQFKMVDNLVLVATLIATASFAAAFTVPGGFDSDNGSKQGTPYLLRKAAFQAFVITDAIAFCCSCCVLLAHIVLLIYRNRYDEAGEVEQNYIDDRILMMYFLSGFALLAMLIAFFTGFYVVLLPSLWLAIFVCALSICIVVVSLSFWL